MMAEKATPESIRQAQRVRRQMNYSPDKPNSTPVLAGLVRFTTAVVIIALIGLVW